jgi:hypothetical protein
MKKIYILSTVAISLLYVGCGSAEVRNDGKIMSSLNVGNYSTQTGYVRDVDTRRVSNFTTEGTAVDIALSKNGNIAYLASGDGGLEVIDVSDPENPRYIKSYDLFEYTNYVEVKDDIVYAAYVTENTRPYMDIKAFDISNPYNPVYIGSNDYRSSVAHYRVKSNNYMIETNDDGIAIFQADGRSYVKAGSYNLGDHAYAVAVKNNYIFVANGRDGLTILRSNIGGSSGRFISSTK